MKANGIEVLQSAVITTKGSAVTRYAYLDTIKQCGIISEFIVTTLKELPLQAYHGIGCITGDVNGLKYKFGSRIFANRPSQSSIKLRGP